MRARIAALIGAAVLALGALTGCGGGGDASSSQARVLTTYLAQSEEANELWQRGRTIYNDAMDELPIGTPVAGPKVIAVGERVPESVDLLTEASVLQRAATPPEALREINEKFAQDMTALADYWDSLGGALRDEDGERFNRLGTTGYGSGAGAGAGIRSEWRVAVTAYAREAGVEMPAWTETIGRVIDDDSDATSTAAPRTSATTETNGDDRAAARAEAARQATATKARAQRAARARAARAKQARAQAQARTKAARARAQTEARARARAKAARAATRARAARQATTPAVYAESDPEFLLGKIDHGIDDGTDPRLRQYAKAITKLKGACGANRMRIADRATSIMNTLDERAGVTVTTLEVLQGVGIASEADVGWSCEDLFVGWAVVREAEG